MKRHIMLVYIFMLPFLLCTCISSFWSSSQLTLWLKPCFYSAWLWFTFPFCRFSFPVSIFFPLRLFQQCSIASFSKNLNSVLLYFTTQCETQYFARVTCLVDVSEWNCSVKSACLDSDFENGYFADDSNSTDDVESTNDGVVTIIDIVIISTSVIQKVLNKSFDTHSAIKSLSKQKRRAAHCKTHQKSCQLTDTKNLT